MATGTAQLRAHRHTANYRKILESYSARLLPLIEWERTDKKNVRVLNDTGDYYRFFDATPHAEFLYERVERTIEVDLPAETSPESVLPLVEGLSRSRQEAAGWRHGAGRDLGRGQGPSP
jgi:hypothetical protein